MPFQRKAISFNEHIPTAEQYHKYFSEIAYSHNFHLRTEKFVGKWKMQRTQKSSDSTVLSTVRIVVAVPYFSQFINASTFPSLVSESFRILIENKEMNITEYPVLCTRTHPCP